MSTTTTAAPAATRPIIDELRTDVTSIGQPISSRRPELGAHPGACETRRYQGSRLSVNLEPGRMSLEPGAKERFPECRFCRWHRANSPRPGDHSRRIGIA